MVPHLHPDTLAIHGGTPVADGARGCTPPIHQTAAYELGTSARAADLFALREDGHIYSRMDNPTCALLEERVCLLEGGEAACTFASGLAAVTGAVLTMCAAGDNLVATSALYGGTVSLLAHTVAQCGVEVRFCDPDRPEDVAALVDGRTRLVYGEMIANPGLAVLDVPAWAAAAHAHHLPLVVDNTVPTPLLCRPLALGADIVVHSLTKYIAGHGTAIGGIVVDGGRREWAVRATPLLDRPDPAYHGTVWSELMGPLAFSARLRAVVLRNTGAALAPMNAFLILQGLQTLPLRIARHVENAMAVARHLAAHPGVAWVRYPGLPDDPGHAVARRVLRGGFGGLVALGPRGGRAAGARLIDALALFSHVANLGDVRSLAIHPASTTHSQLTPAELRAAGVPEDLVRLSVGLEHPGDLVADLDQALACAALAAPAAA